MQVMKIALVASALAIVPVSVKAKPANFPTLSNSGSYQGYHANIHRSTKYRHYVRRSHHRAMAARHYQGSHKSVRRARGSISTAGMPAPLANKIAELQTYCSAHVISGYRPGAVIAGTHHPSLHGKNAAADLVGDYPCMKARLVGYAGGASTDYYRMRHLHISWGGPEMGLRFVHGGGHKYHRYARRHRHQHYARVG